MRSVRPWLAGLGVVAVLSCGAYQHLQVAPVRTTITTKTSTQWIARPLHPELLAYQRQVVRWNNAVRWNNTIRWNDTVRWDRAVAENVVAVESPPVSAVAVSFPSPMPPVAATTQSMPCGGTEYPPCYVAQRESGNTYTAYNGSGCGGNGCYGRWQFSGAWACKLGLPCNLASASPAQQDNAARLLWAGGAGCSNWAAC